MTEKRTNPTEAKKDAMAKLRRMTNGKFDFNVHTPEKHYTKMQLMAMGISEGNTAAFNRAVREYNKYIKM